MQKNAFSQRQVGRQQHCSIGWHSEFQELLSFFLISKIKKLYLRTLTPKPIPS